MVVVAQGGHNLLRPVAGISARGRSSGTVGAERDPESGPPGPEVHLGDLPTRFGLSMATERKRKSTVRASEGPVYKGVCKCFCRSKGHGFITPADGGPDIFLHISDVEGEYVPVEGDEVTYKMCSIPPKNEKLQAVEVVITHLVPGTKHETWSGRVISS
ncbi:calcium-regulated heat-stable protein 1 isoform X1 [Ornithorhynchus anatinus]|uniref:calcium-regulated heat-stable protein 1 isoform X1 n=1 Tax=Ornithorhynchus anatinus TaxID=9258 RepID=UPI0010A82349|nr:calcium-regulated heat-stable protein 1 isoform X1 [Ornithorhynchus anatinus]